MIIRINQDCWAGQVWKGGRWVYLCFFQKDSRYSDIEKIDMYWKIKKASFCYYVDQQFCDVIDTDELKAPQPQNKPKDFYLNLLFEKLIKENYE